MAFNLAQGKTDRFGLGSGILYIGPWPGGTPSIDVGYGRGATLTITRTVLEVLQGMPRTPVFRFVTQEAVSLQFTGLQWDLDRLADCLGAGELSGSPATLLDFGGDVNLKPLQVRFVHQLPAGQTAELRLWKAQGSGEFTLNFPEDNVLEFPWNFTAIDAETRWSGATNGQKSRLMQISLAGTFS